MADNSLYDLCTSLNLSRLVQDVFASNTSLCLASDRAGALRPELSEGKAVTRNR